MEAFIFWLLAGLQAVGILLNIALIDKPRKPLTRGTAIAVCITGSLTIWGLYVLWVN